MSREEKAPLRAAPQYGSSRDGGYTPLFSSSPDEEDASSIRLPRSVAYCCLVYATVVTVGLLACILALLLHGRRSPLEREGGAPVTPLPPITQPPYSSPRHGALGSASCPAPPPSSSSVSSSNFLVLADIHLEPHYDATQQQSDRRVCRNSRHTDACLRTDWELSQRPPSSPAVKSSSPSAFDFSHGRYLCDPPDALVSSSLASLSAFLSSSSTSPDFVLIAGDLAAHFVSCPLTLYHTIDRVVGLIAAAFPSTPLILTLGNTDVFPTDHLPIPALALPLEEVSLVNCGAQFRSVLSVLFRHGLLTPDDEEAVRTFCHGGYYSRLLNSGRVRVLSLNTLVWATEFTDQLDWTAASSSPGAPFEQRSRWRDNATAQPIELTPSTLSFGFPSSHPSNLVTAPALSCSSPSRVDDPYGQFRWLRAQLRLASLSDPPEAVYVLGHQPPGIKPSQSPSPSWCPQYQRRFRQAVARWPAAVRGLFFGDYSQDVVRLLGLGAREEAKVAHVNPGLSPRKNVNPAARVYQYDTVNGRILDFHQLYVDLTALQVRARREEDGAERQAVQWAWQYSAVEHYGMDEYGAEGWLNVVRRMREDRETLERYMSAVNVWKLGDGDGALYACDIVALDEEENAECRRTGVLPLTPGKCGEG